jgi:ABC-type transport system involved in multi-copper enzyme maturation permease subunit
MAVMSWIMTLTTLAALVIIVAAVLQRRAVFYLFGPVFFYETMRLSRRGRLFGLRIAYAGTLLVLIFLTYQQHMERFGLHEGPFERIAMDPREIAKLATAIFSAFMIAQTIAVFLLTPVFTATAIVEEKERGTLELLFACGMTSREIVMGKLAARMLQVYGLLLTGLPVITILQLLGGVDPNRVIAGFAVTGLAALSLGSVGVLTSLRAKSPFDAIFRTYLIALGYSVVTACVPFLNVWSFQPSLFWEDPEEQTLIQLLAMLALFMLVHGLIILLCLRLAIVQLRDRCLAFQDAPPGRRSPWSDRAAPPVDFIVPRPRPPTRPLRFMLWKERYVDRGLLQRNPGVLGCLALVFIWMGIPFILYVLSWIPQGWSGEDTNERIRVLSVALFAPVPLLVGLGAAGRISRERERHTLDNFLTTPLTRTEILLGKALAAVSNVSYLLGAVVVVWVIGFVSIGLNFFMIPFLVGAAAVHIAFAAALGLYCSAHCGSTVRAMIVTVITLLALNLLPLCLGEGSIISPPVAMWNLCIGYNYSADDNPVAAFLLTYVGFGFFTALFWTLTRLELQSRSG